MQADLGNNPSYVWRSICWGKKLLEGLKWNIANGRHIDTRLRDWFASWAPTALSLCKIPDRKVANYIDNNGNWIEQDIGRDFLSFEAEEILNTSIMKDGDKNFRFWSLHPKGVYTVSSGYRKKADLLEKFEERHKARS